MKQDLYRHDALSDLKPTLSKN